MGDTERPVEGRPEDQDAQAQHLRRTGNGPTEPREAELLRERFGTPDMAGVYIAPEAAREDQPEDAGPSEPATPEDGKGGKS
ncbi:hypothetical protein [Streptomyces chumphonensis]|uniref:hypothetical protein n=1 Tax=Streptomyces chumphonensis TaxID=1214925 RepID=UPI003D70C504